MLFRRVCKKCGAAIEVPILYSFAALLAGSALGWQLGVPDEVIRRMSPMVMVLLVNKPVAAVVGAYFGVMFVRNHTPCPACHKAAAES